MAGGYPTQPPPTYEQSTGFAPKSFAKPGTAEAGYSPPSYYGPTNPIASPPVPPPAPPPGNATYQSNNEGPQLKRAQNIAKWWHRASFIACILFLPLGIPAAIFTHKAKKSAKNGDMTNYLKNLGIGSRLAGAGIGVGISFTLNIALRLPFWRKDGKYNKLPPWTNSGISIGCYYDDMQDILSEDFKVLGSSSRIECVSYCAFQGFLYAGQQEETQCYCGSSLEVELQDDDCVHHHYCKRNKTKCEEKYVEGAIYRTNYLGCFKGENGNGLEKLVINLTETSSVQSKCIDQCADKNYEFAGLKSAYLCYCGNDPNRYNADSEGSCDASCSSGQSLVCGGSDSSSVFKTHFISDNSHKYLGCYKDDISERDLSGYSFNVEDEDIFESCLANCTTRGYRYAGLQSDDSCFCGNSYGKHGESPDSECKDEPDRNAVYRSQYLGCFGNSAAEHAQFVSDESSPFSCMKHCDWEGFLFAELKDGGACYCLQQPDWDRQVLDDRCDMQCSSDTKSICGSETASSVLRI